MAKRTTAQRRAAAKAAWARRKALSVPAVAEFMKGNEPPKLSTEALLNERGKTHGSFVRNAEVSQRLKDIFQYYGGDLHVVQKEALDMIALKISRILSGQGAYADHWDDIAGYATLAKTTV
jgi:hypothetical protein